MINRGQKIRFGVIQATYWCSIASFSFFAIAFVRSKGISATFIGVMLAVFMLSAVIGQFFWGAICDKFQSNKRVFLLTNALMLTFTLLFYFSSSQSLLLITYAFMGFLQAPTAANLDSWILKSASNDFSIYGPIRSAGSLGFAVFVFFYGSLVASSGYWVMPFFHVLFVLLTIITAVSLPEEKTNMSVSSTAKITVSDIRALFTSSRYLYLLIVLFFVGFSTMSIGQMKILIWENLHASIAYQGFDGFFSGLFQVPFMLFMARLKGINSKVRLTMGVLSCFAMIVIIYFARIPQLVVVGDILGGAGYGLLLPAMREIIVHSTPEKLRTTAQGVGDAVYNSLSGIIGSLLSGVFIDWLGVKAMILFLACVYIIPVILVLFQLIPKKQTQDTAQALPESRH